MGIDRPGLRFGLGPAHRAGRAVTGVLSQLIPQFFVSGIAAGLVAGFCRGNRLDRFAYPRMGARVRLAARGRIPARDSRRRGCTSSPRWRVSSAWVRIQVARWVAASYPNDQPDGRPSRLFPDALQRTQTRVY
jgi:hypothetical protein